MVHAFGFQRVEKLSEMAFGGAQAYMQRRQELKYRAVFGDNRSDDDFDDENDSEYDSTEKDPPFDPDVFSRREVNARLQQYTKGDRDWQNLKN